MNVSIETYFQKNTSMNIPHQKSCQRRNCGSHSTGLLIRENLKLQNGVSVVNRKKDILLSSIF